MFPHRYFPTRYFPNRYFPIGGGAPAPVAAPMGGWRLLRRRPIIDDEILLLV